MKDRSGNHIMLGDKVLYLTAGTSTSWLVWGTVTGFTPQMVVIQPRDNGRPVRKHPRGVVRPILNDRFSFPGADRN